ncbi:MAG: hypothetical protein K6F14_03015 [Clostridiales bacterium]|nr:hypothetical protein [Clostridiales bacterium]
MAKVRSSLLLKIISIIFFVWGILFVVTQIIGLFGGSVNLGAAVWAGAVAGWVGAILEFICGFLGLKGRALFLATILDIILIGLVVYSFIMSLFNGFQWTDLITLINIILPALYLVGVKRAYIR